MGTIYDESGLAFLDEAGNPIWDELGGGDLQWTSPQARVALLDHTTDGAARLLHQYRPAIRLKALMDALFGQQMQDLENHAHQLYGLLDIDAGQGAQLDLIGTIVGQSRMGHSDRIYKLLLKAKIGANVSHGTIEDVIGVWRLLAQANQVQVVEVYPAQVDLYSDTPIDGAIAAFVRVLMQKVVAAGVRVDFLAIIYSSTNAFGFDGEDPTIGGFGDYNDAGAGGEFAYIQLTN